MKTTTKRKQADTGMPRPLLNAAGAFPLNGYYAILSYAMSSPSSRQTGSIEA
jgi:hypothetical protein